MNFHDGMGLQYTTFQGDMVFEDIEHFYPRNLVFLPIQLVCANYHELIIINLLGHCLATTSNVSYLPKL